MDKNAITPNWNKKESLLSKYGVAGSHFGTTCVLAIAVNLIVAANLVWGLDIRALGAGVGGYAAWAALLTVGELLLGLAVMFFQPQA